MKKFLLSIISFLLVQVPASSNQPFRYNTKCYVGQIEDQCVIIETRETGGALKSRNIFSNRAGLTIKMWWDKNKNKFVQTDSHNKFEYNWVYKANPEIVENGITATEVMPGVFTFVSWD